MNAVVGRLGGRSVGRFLALLGHLDQKQKLTLCYMGEKCPDTYKFFRKFSKKKNLPQISIIFIFKPFRAKQNFDPMLHGEKNFPALRNFFENILFFWLKFSGGAYFRGSYFRRFTVL